MTEKNQQLTAATNKNDFINACYPMVSASGANKTDFTEVFVTEMMSDIQKVLDKNGKLYKTTWNTNAKRKDYNSKTNKYFTDAQGDYSYRPFQN